MQYIVDALKQLFSLGNLEVKYNILSTQVYRFDPRKSYFQIATEHFIKSLRAISLQVAFDKSFSAWNVNWMYLKNSITDSYNLYHSDKIRIRST